MCICPNLSSNTCVLSKETVVVSFHLYFKKCTFRKMTEFRIERIPNPYRIPVPKPETPKSYSKSLPELELVPNSDLLTAHEPCKLPKPTEFKIQKIPNPLELRTLALKARTSETVTNSDPLPLKLPKLVINSNLGTSHELPKSTEFRILKIPNIDSKTEKNEPLAESKSITNSDHVTAPVPPKLPKLVKLHQNLSRVHSKKKNCGCCACSHAHSGEPFIADWPFMLKYEDQVNHAKGQLNSE